MSITDELRKWAEDNTLQDTVLTTYPPQHAVHGVLETLLAIADRIDAEHESACGKAYSDGVMSVPIALDESAWVKLPVDADGVPIHIGDVMESDHYEDGTVVGMQYFKAPNDSLRLLIAVKPHFLDTPTWRDPECYRHYHAPTVEDVLREFVERWHDTHHDDIPALFAEFSAKLRLAGDVK